MTQLDEPFDAGEAYQLVMQQLIRLDDLDRKTESQGCEQAEEFTKWIAEIKAITEWIAKEYHGPNHSALHRAIREHLPNAYGGTIAELACTLPIESFDSLHLMVEMLASLMRIAEWDGTTVVPDATETTPVEIAVIQKGILDVIMMAFQVSPETMESLVDFLSSQDRQIILATLVYVLSWFHGRCREPVGIPHLVPILHGLRASNDPAIALHANCLCDLIAKRQQR